MLADRLDLGSLPDVGLGEVLAAAPALTRVDRKYLVPLDAVRAVLDRLDPAWAVLALPAVPVGGPGAGPGSGVRHSTHYRTTYVDTPDLLTVRAHVQGRRRRWKARSRLYVEDGLVRTEVKAKDGRGRTVKTVRDGAAYAELTPADRAFVAATLAGHRIDVDADRLGPVVEVAYERTTLARLDEQPSRMTLDWGVTGTRVPDTDGSRPASGEVRVDRDHVLVETKGGLRPGDADRALAALGHRPTSFSKYAAVATLLHPAPADNDVRRLLGRVLHVVPHLHPSSSQPAVGTPDAGTPDLWSRSA